MVGRKHTPEELAMAQRILAERKPHMDKMRADIRNEKVAASETIAMLQRRTKTQTVDLVLEGGDTIRIYSRLSESDMQRIESFENERLEHIRHAEEKMAALKKVTDVSQIDPIRTDIDSLFGLAADCWLQVIAIVTVDPAITYGWLKQNPDMYSPEDIVDVYMAYRESRKQQITDRVKRVQSFREHVAGQGIHPAPALVGH